MNKRLYRLIVISLAIIAALISNVAGADDTDLFAANPPGSSLANPNVLLMLDNSANWSATLAGTTKFRAEMTALNTVIGSISNKVNLGLELFGESGRGNSNPVTAYMRYAVRDMNATNKSALKALFAGLNILGDKGSNAPYGFGLLEAFKYFGGGNGSPQGAAGFGPIAFGGFGQLKRDYPGNLRNTLAGNLTGNAFVSATSNRYVSPISSTNACAKNYVVVISNGLPQAGGDAGTPSASNILKALGGDNAIATIPLSNTVAQGNLGDEYARLLYNADVSSEPGAQNITTYTIFVYDPTRVTGSDAANVVLLKSMASQGRGKYFAAYDAASLVRALTAIFNEVQSVNDVFAAVTLPINVGVRGTSLNQVYMGVFRPDQNAQPRWMGNLKQYQIISQNGSLVLGDKNRAQADNPSTGFISPNATSFWTSPSTFWAFQPSGLPLSGSDSPDGAVVEKGAAAQRLRSIYATSQETRKLYTCASCSSGTALSASPFTISTVNPGSGSTQAAFGATNATYVNASTGITGREGEVTDIVNWVRGADNSTDEDLDGIFSDIRASVHGSVVHSRPAVVNYNRFGTCSNLNADDTYVFYGANDGVFHALKGGQGASDGQEQWGFVLPEVIGKLKRLRDNSPAVTLNNLPPSDTTNNTLYFADGPVSVFQLDANNDCRYTSGISGDKVYIFISMRRGGQVLYALDVTNPTTPKYLWKVAPGSNFPELGYTWSMPVVANIKLHGTATPVVVFGGGYDPAVEDLDPQFITSATATSVTSSAGGGVTTTRTLGRRLFVVRISDGRLLWSAGPTVGPGDGSYSAIVAGMSYAMPSDPTVLDTNRDGLDDRIYIGDTGANIWRIDISNEDPAQWAVVPFASLDNSARARRKFLFPVSVVADGDAAGLYHAVLVGSGDREHPFDKTINNRFYMLKDRATSLLSSQTSPITESALVDATSTSPTEPSGGFYINMATGEKIVSSSTVLAGTVFFNTNTPPAAPAANVCSANDLGKALLYAVSYSSGEATLFESPTTSDPVRTLDYPGGGLPPSPVPAAVEVDGHTVQVVITGTTVTKVPGPPLGARVRTFWNESIDKP